MFYASRGSRLCYVSCCASRSWLVTSWRDSNCIGRVVTSSVSNRLAVDSGLMEGDVIHALNRTPIARVDILKDVFNKLQPGEPAAKQVERNDKLTYLTFETE